MTRCCRDGAAVVVIARPRLLMISASYYRIRFSFFYCYDHVCSYGPVSHLYSDRGPLDCHNSAVSVLSLLGLPIGP